MYKSLKTKEKLNVAILGSTGAVGRQIMQVLAERNFPIKVLFPLASSNSAGSQLDYNGQQITVLDADKFDYSQVDIVFGATSNSVAKVHAPKIVANGALFIDNSSSFRMNDDVPLVIPEINADDAFNNNGIISNPNCSTIITLTALNGINRVSKIEKIIASTYQAASGAGAAGPVELEAGTNAYFANETFTNKVFTHPLAFNLIAEIGSPDKDGYTTEEMKMQREGRKIFHNPNLQVTCTCVRVPVMRSHSISATVITKDHIDVEQAKHAIEAAPGCILRDDLCNNVIPTPLESSDTDDVYVGRIRKDLTDRNGITLWCCGDQVRKGAATNAIQIAELFIK